MANFQRKDFTSVQIVSKGTVPVGDAKKRQPGAMVIIDGVTKHLVACNGCYRDKAGNTYEI